MAESSPLSSPIRPSLGLTFAPSLLGLLDRASSAVLCLYSLLLLLLGDLSLPLAPLDDAFSPDGVLKQGQHVLPQAKQVMQILNGNNPLQKRYPFICVTNGGGTLESARCKKLTKELGVEIGEHQIVQSHTIFRSFVPRYADKPVFVVGGNSDHCRQVAEAYGFKHVYIPADVLRWQPSAWPYHKLTEKEMAYSRDVDFSTISFAAVLVFHDSRDWGRDLQLTLDLVRAQDGVFGTLKDPKDKEAWRPERQLPVHFSNPDLLWGNDFSQARFGQGALQESMAAVYKMTTGCELQRLVPFPLLSLPSSPPPPRALSDSLSTRRTTGGKPTLATYEYCSQLLYSAIEHAAVGKPIDLYAKGEPAKFEGRVYMVGDNPRSDIAGEHRFAFPFLPVDPSTSSPGLVRLRAGLSLLTASPVPSPLFLLGHCDTGANNFGWESILVQTGVFRGDKPEDAEHVPTVVKRDVLEGIKWALEREGEGGAIAGL
ncbi:SPOSA6832_04222 [Sporobolomyces salmonicolor]|uniref:SPOSA6832_04222-mRNA-1:cds n=1 Tax=Sporidiobolus salmonicolor TaxID=5005 RepID=A0A0D6EQQ7_SPOSA|nr:SPOSA6832_04222 [Sporobolomyces salmonicolor]